MTITIKHRRCSQHQEVLQILTEQRNRLPLSMMMMNGVLPVVAIGEAGHSLRL